MLVLATMARGLLMLSQRLMLVCTMEDMDMVLVLDMAVLAMLVLDTMARGLLMLSQRLMLVCTMEDMDMVLDLDMDIPVLDMLDMVVMDSDTVLDTAVPSMVKQLIYASKSSKVIFLLFSALIWGRKLFFMF